jgi:endonuclease/exonuclease/phosphatase family metal-dependent hydrolase
MPSACIRCSNPWPGLTVVMMSTPGSSVGDFNATLERPSAQLMASVFRPTQTAPTAFSPLQDTDGTVSHPYWPRFDRGIDYMWVACPPAVRASGVCFDIPSTTDSTLWPSDHAGVWADLTFI